ncbi:hypothetical protein SAMN05216241_106118 [Limimonas halophila]|uniref:site-specific DNA-methyltransferase (cytosine-N(4)-specific) n=1 Tax=Limimonas halophila TaxID=1082479 RepID=A0A1G7S4K7_9PROT|nr:hypothetical protein [Limimonas halophila]SDG17946.1 hypothetical protein SAMN05216241_106118 [Limimonas halophila]
MSSPLFDNNEFDKQNPEMPPKTARRGAFTDNMRLPVHRWFRFSAGFSAEWAEDVIAAHVPPHGRALDPFAGSGTALIAGAQAQCVTDGFETHPLLNHLTATKMRPPSCEEQFRREAFNVLRLADNMRSQMILPHNKLLRKCYTDDVLYSLKSLKEAYERYTFSSESIANHVWWCITSILRETSGVGTAQWQYILPNHSKNNVYDPYYAFMNKVEIFHADMKIFKTKAEEYAGSIYNIDARKCEKMTDKQYNLVITSPPYPNNYDYADATRLELTFWGHVDRWADLHKKVRQCLIPSCAQHTSTEKMLLEPLLQHPVTSPIRSELTEVCTALQHEREKKGGRKTYHTMLAAYFRDLGRTFHALRPLVVDGGTLCLIIGDSAPYGIHAPVDKWLGELAQGAGFKEYTFEKVRDRNIKWKNRKHRVPLKEGILWIRG